MGGGGEGPVHGRDASRRDSPRHPHFQAGTSSDETLGACLASRAAPAEQLSGQALPFLVPTRGSHQLPNAGEMGGGPLSHGNIT